MSPKRKTKQDSADISIKGGVKGVGNVVGNNSQSRVSISSPTEVSSPKSRASAQSAWSRVAAFLVALVGILAAISVFVRLTEEINAWLIVQLVLAGLVTALGVSGFLRPNLLADLFTKLFGKK